MIKARYIVVLFIALALVPTALAQNVSRGSIGGVVEDATGAVVAGAKVTASSQYGSREATTEGDGSFLIQNLEPGKWNLKVGMSGFKTAEVKEVDVRLNERANITIKLEPGAVTEIVEVSGATVGIDLSTTSSGANIPATLFYNAPVSRNITDIPYLAAGVGDSLGVGQPNPSISGGTGLENMYIVNGVNITNAGYGAIGSYSNIYGSLGSGVQFDFVKEVQVKTSGFEAQYGQSIGGIVNMITKSGGNDYHGSGYFYAGPAWLEATRRQPNRTRFNKSDELLGVSTYDVGGEVGGYISKDRAFWYAGFDTVFNNQDRHGPANFLSNALGEVSVDNRVYNYSAKLNANITKDQNHQFEASIFGDPANQPTAFVRSGGRGAAGALTSDFPERRSSALKYGSVNWTLRYNGVIKPTWLMNASFNWARNRVDERDFPSVWRIEDRTEGTVGGVNPVGDGIPTPATSRGLNELGGLGFFENTVGNNKQYAINGSNSVHGLGSHQVDYGVTYEDIDYQWFHARTGPNWIMPCFNFTGAGINFRDGIGAASADCGATNFGFDGRLQLGNPAFGFFITQRRGAFTGKTGTTHSKYGALYLQDAWALNRFITLKLGLRWEQQIVRGVDAEYHFTNNYSPRVGIIVDPWGDRKTKAFFNFGRFFEKMPLDGAVRSLSNESAYLNMRFAVSNPFALNPLWNSILTPANASAACAAAPATLAGLQTCLDDPANWIADSVHNLNNTAFFGSPVFTGGITVFAPGTKMQYQDEYVVGVEHEFRGGVLVSGRYLDRRVRRIVEDLAGATPGCANDGTCVQQFVLGNPTASTDIFLNTHCNDPNEDPTIEDLNLGVGCLASGYVGPSITDGGPGAGGDLLPDGLADGFPQVVRRYRAFELGVEKRFSKNWQFISNLRVADLVGNYEGLFRNDNGQDDPNITSLFDFVGGSLLGDQFKPGPLPTDRRYTSNVYASYLFDNGFNFGVGWRVQTGYPLSKLQAHPVYLNQGEVPLGGRGAFGRSPITSNFDLHGDYTWKVTERYRVKFVADLFNVLNMRRLNRVDQFSDTGFLSGVNPPIQPNPDFLGPTRDFNAYQRPFNARLAIRFEF